MNTYEISNDPELYNLSELSEVLESIEYFSVKNYYKQDDEIFKENLLVIEENSSGPLLTPEQQQEIAMGLEQGSMTQDQLNDLVQQGQLSPEDIESIQNIIQQSDYGISPEEELEIKNNKIEDINSNYVKVLLYEKISYLDEKLGTFIDIYTKKNSENYIKLKYIKNYVNALKNISMSLDANLLYQFIANIEMKIISLFKKELGITDNDDMDLFFENLKESAKRKEEKLIQIKQQQEEEQKKNEEEQQEEQRQQTITLDEKHIKRYANWVIYGKLTEEDIQQKIENKEFTQADVAAIMYQVKEYNEEEIDKEIKAENSINMINQHDQNIPNSNNFDEPQTNDEKADNLQPETEEITLDMTPEEIAEKIINGSIDPKELIAKFMKGEIDKKDFMKVNKAIEFAIESNKPKESKKKIVNAEELE